MQRCDEPLELKSLACCTHRTFRAMTPSLANFLGSLAAGLLIVLVPATVGLIFISQKDKVSRRS